MRSLGEARKDVPDHRSRLGQRNRLSVVLVFMCTGMLCGCQSLQALTSWGKRQAGAVLRAMGFGCGRAPGYGTLQRLVSDLNVEALFGWAQDVLQAQTGQEGWQGSPWMARYCAGVGRVCCRGASIESGRSGIRYYPGARRCATEYERSQSLFTAAGRAMSDQSGGDRRCGLHAARGVPIDYGSC
jgi:hypothetical protein